MPCTYTGSLDGDKIYFLEEALKGVRCEMDQLTRMLCEIMTQIDKGEEVYPARAPTPSAELRLWWKNHKKADKKKAKEQRSRK